MLILLLPTFTELGPILLLVLSLLGAIIAWKTGLVQQLTSGQKDLLALKDAELTQSKAKVAELSVRLHELEEYNRLLILNSRTTMEVAMEIKESKLGRKKVQHDE
jgi:hypothetical protein